MECLKRGPVHPPSLSLTRNQSVVCVCVLCSGLGPINCGKFELCVCVQRCVWQTLFLSYCTNTIARFVRGRSCFFSPTTFVFVYKKEGRQDFCVLFYLSRSFRGF